MNKVSIIVPVYNVEKYLEKCLTSIVNQTYKNIEVIVINDGSPDNCQIIIDKFKNKYNSIIKSVVKKNGGLGSARNSGIDIATGEYIIFIDSDDWIEDNMIQLMVETIEKDKSDIVVCDIIDEYENGKSQIYKNSYKTCLTNFNDDKTICLNRPAAWNKLYRKKIFDNLEYRYISNKWYEDLRLIMKIYPNVNKISFISVPLYHYLIRTGSIMNNSNVERNLEILEAFDEIIEYYKSNNLFNDYSNELEILAIDNIIISAITRIIRSGKIINKDIIHRLISFMNHNFPNHRENIYLKSLPRNRKIVYNLIIRNHYRLVKMIFKYKNR